MGSIHLVPFLGENYNLLVPLLMVIVVSAIVARIDRKIIYFLRLDAFFYLESTRSEASRAELANEGHELIRYARSMEERKAEGMDRLPSSSGSSVFQPFKGKYEPVFNPTAN